MPKPCNLKTARTPKSESCSTPYELFTADKLGHPRLGRGATGWPCVGMMTSGAGGRLRELYDNDLQHMIFGVRGEGRGGSGCELGGNDRQFRGS